MNGRHRAPVKLRQEIDERGRLREQCHERLGRACRIIKSAHRWGAARRLAGRDWCTHRNLGMHSELPIRRQIVRQWDSNDPAVNIGRI